jgi:hypothetical protein
MPMIGLTPTARPCSGESQRQGVGVVEHGQVAQAVEVHLEQAEGLAGAHVQLGDDRAVLLAALDRDDVQQRLGAQDDAGRVHAPLPLEALQAAGGVDDALDVRVGVVQRPELASLGVPAVGRLEDAGERDVLAHHRRRHRLGDPVAERVRVAQDPGCVLDGGLRLGGAAGDDLRDPLLAVLRRGVADHLGASALVEVQVDVRHRDALGVEEPLEDQPVLERVELGDAQAVRDDGARGGTPAGADPDAVLPRVPAQVGDDEEVAREAHLADDADLVRGLLAVPVRDAAGEASGQPALDLGDQPGLLGLPRRGRDWRRQQRGNTTSRQ